MYCLMKIVGDTVQFVVTFVFSSSNEYFSTTCWLDAFELGRRCVDSHKYII